MVLAALDFAAILGCDFAKGFIAMTRLRYAPRL